MSKEDATRFISVWKAQDPVLKDALEEQPKEALNDPTLLSEIARNLGFQVTVAELIEQINVQRKECLTLLECSELSEEELDQVAGGIRYRIECSSDYAYYETCTFDDRCRSLFNVYKQDIRCSSGFDTHEECIFDDQCTVTTNKY